MAVQYSINYHKGVSMKSLLHKFLPVLVTTSIFLVSCSTPNIIVAPVIAATPTAVLSATETSTPPQSDDVWDHIQGNKKMVVGTSWDYPPFSSVNSDFEVVGFDMALIEEIGRRLNIPIEVQNYAFEGLPDALRINQIDLAVAAISLTPERDQQMSFSPVYFVNETSVLARNDTLVPDITNFDQLAKYRVGVQRGSTYESMVQTYLVDTGKMGAEKLLRYMQTDEAVRDLIVNRVDVVIVGQATASYYGSREDLRVVANGFQQQNLAVAMRLDTPRLNAEITKVIDDMLKDGTILSFIQQYIQSDVAGTLSTPIPSIQNPATPFPPLPTITPQACVNGMKFVADVTIEDNNMKTPPFIKPGESFVKIWRVENNGTCTWTPDYHLVYAYGNVYAAQMNGQRVSVPFAVAPGQLVDLSVSLVAPKDPLTYQGFWQMETETGKRFGQTIWVAISTTENPVAVAPTRLPSGNTCEVTITSPTNFVKVNSAFDAIWSVKNTSGTNWNADSVDYMYISGTEMHEKSVYDFTQTVNNGASGKIIVDMVSPGAPGQYTTNWAIVSGNTTLCSMSVTVSVTQ
jgi:polar amino acid transport system substrate-binding protein